MGDRTAGPFWYYDDLHPGVTGDSIRASTWEPALRGAELQALAGELEDDGVAITRQLHGDLTTQVIAAPNAVATRALSLAAKGLYAAGLIRDFASMVDNFDASVSQINQDYQQRVSAAVFAAQHDPDVRTGEVAVDRAGIAAAIEADLRPRWHQAQQRLDDDADTIATRLRQGPTTANVRDLIRSGLLPLGAASLYPGLHLTAADKRAARDAADDDGWPLDLAQFLGLLPGDDPAATDWAQYATGLAGFGANGYANWFSLIRKGVFAPNFRLPSGLLSYQSLAPFRGYSPSAAWNRFRIMLPADALERNFRAYPYQGSAKAFWNSVDTWGARAGGVVTAVTAGWDQWQDDSDDPSLDQGERVDRTATTAVSTGAAAWAGAEVGAWGGAAIGTAICPGVGTAVGAFVGGVIGGAAGAWAGSEAAEVVNEKFDGAVHAVGDAAGWVGDKLGLW